SEVRTVALDPRQYVIGCRQTAGAAQRGALAHLFEAAIEIEASDGLVGAARGDHPHRVRIPRPLESEDGHPRNGSRRPIPRLFAAEAEQQQRAIGLLSIQVGDASPVRRPSLAREATGPLYLGRLAGVRSPMRVRSPWPRIRSGCDLPPARPELVPEPQSIGGELERLGRCQGLQLAG